MNRPATAKSEDLWVRPLQCIPDLLREGGVRPHSVFRKARVSLRALSDSGNRLDFTQVGRLVDECAAATGCEHFGLLVGQRSGTASVGILQELMAFTRTLRAALHALRSHLHLHDRGAALTLSELPGAYVEIAYVIFRPNAPGAAQIADGALAILLLLLRGLIGPAWNPVRVTIARRRPRDPTPYRNLFRTTVSFDAPRCALIVPSRLLDRALPNADARAETAIRAVIAKAEAANPRSLTLQVRQLASAMLVGGTPPLPRIASALGMSSRTLRRRLADEGTTASAIVDGTKAELARQLIVETRMTIQEIAETLHYSAPGAFTRAYVGWAGIPPRTERKAALRAR